MRDRDPFPSHLVLQQEHYFEHKDEDTDHGEFILENYGIHVNLAANY